MGKRTLRLGALCASLLIARLAAAQTEPPVPDAAPPAPAEKPPAAAKSIVVVADPFDDETENAKLRARVYEAGRGQGYSADTKLDVRDKAIDAGAMKEGRVSTDEASLQSLRKSVGASVLVRIARDSRGVRVMVVRDGGMSDDVVKSPDAVPDTVVRLLSGKKGAAAATGEGIEAGYITRRPSGEPDKDLGDPKQLAKSWEERGGLRPTYGARVLLIGLLIPKTPFADTNPVTGATEIGEARTFGVGAGVGFQVGMMYLSMPSPSTGKAWQGFRLSTGLDLTGLYVRTPKGYEYKQSAGSVTSRDTDFDNVSYVYGIIPFQLGVHFGIGEFKLPTLWRGIALGVAYSPAVLLSLKVGEKEDKTDSHFNPAGFEVSIDSVKIEADQGNQPQLRFSAMVLPKVSDDLPWIGEIGIGAFWY